MPYSRGNYTIPLRPVLDSVPVAAAPRLCTRKKAFSPNATALYIPSLSFTVEIPGASTSQTPCEIIKSRLVRRLRVMPHQPPISGATKSPSRRGSRLGLRAKTDSRIHPCRWIESDHQSLRHLSSEHAVFFPYIIYISTAISLSTVTSTLIIERIPLSNYPSKACLILFQDADETSITLVRSRQSRLGHEQRQRDEATACAHILSYDKEKVFVSSPCFVEPHSYLHY